MLEKIPNKVKRRALPPVGTTLTLDGKAQFKVTYVNVGKMRFTCQFAGLAQPQAEEPGLITAPGSPEGRAILDAVRASHAKG